MSKTFKGTLIGLMIGLATYPLVMYLYQGGSKFDLILFPLLAALATPAIFLDFIFHRFFTDPVVFFLCLTINTTLLGLIIGFALDRNMQLKKIIIVSGVLFVIATIYWFIEMVNAIGTL